MEKLLELIRNLFNSDKVTIDEAGQKTIALEPLLTEVEGFKLFDTTEEMKEAAEDEIKEDKKEGVAVDYAFKSDLIEILARLDRLEKAIDIVDDLGVVKDEEGNIEIW